MRFEILGEIAGIETFANRGPEFAKSAGCARSTDPAAGERKGIARVRLMDGTIHSAEIHWYEAAGIGRKEYKIKYLL
jgi:hypothetical protein